VIRSKIHTEDPQILGAP